MKSEKISYIVLTMGLEAPTCRAEDILAVDELSAIDIYLERTKMTPEHNTVFGVFPTHAMKLFEIRKPPKGYETVLLCNGREED